MILRSTCFHKVLALILMLLIYRPLLAEVAVLSTMEDSRQQSIRVLIIPKVETVLSSQIAAKINALNVDSGSRFKKGQTLVAFECGVQKALLSKANAELDSADKKHQANLRLNEFKSISVLDVAVSNAEVNKAKSVVDVEKARFNMCRIKAPFTGRVIDRKVHAYENVSQGQPLLEILDDSQLQIELFVPSKWLVWLKPGVKFTVRIDETGLEYQASVSGLGARVDPVSHSISLKAIIVGKQKGLLAGMSGSAIFKLP